MDSKKKEQRREYPAAPARGLRGRGELVSRAVFVATFLVGSLSFAQPTGRLFDWQSGGPFGGTVEGMTGSIEPGGEHLLVAATYGGGIFTSDDLGATWTRADGLTSYFVTSIATTPLMPNVLYAGVESKERYIPLADRSKLVKSTDGGLTWFESSTGIQNDEQGRSIPVAVAVSTTDPNLVYAGCEAIELGGLSKKFYRSLDSGSTWMRADTGHTGYSYAISVHPAGGDTLLSGSDLGIFRSTDAASSWAFTYVPGGPFKALLFLPPDPSIVVAGGATGVCRSTDSGVTWSLLTSPTSPGSTVTCFAYEPTEGVLYAGTEGEGLYESDDLGATWSQMVGEEPPLTLISEIAVLDPSIPDRFIAGTRYRGVYRSHDGIGWSWSSDGMKASVARSCEILVDGAIVAGIEKLGIARSADGMTWDYMTGVGQDETVLSFCTDPSDPNTLYAGSESGTLYRSTDAGLTWSAFDTFPGSVVSVGMDAQQVGRIYVCAATDSFYVSTDGGQTWSGHRFAGGGYLGLAVNPLAGSRLLVAAAHPSAPIRGVFRSINAGEDWTLVVENTPTGSVVYDASDTSYAYNGQNLDWGLWRSTDGGESWTMLPGFPGGPSPTCVDVEPSTGFVWGSKGEIGIFYSLDHGDSWCDVTGSNMVNRVVDDVAAREINGSTLAVLCTDGAGVFTSSGIPAWVPSEGDGQAQAATDAGFRIAAWPNPSGAGVDLEMVPSLPGPVRIDVFDLSGRLVRRLDGSRAAGTGLRWDGTDSGGRRAPTGVYLIRVTSARAVALGRVVLL